MTSRASRLLLYQGTEDTGTCSHSHLYRWGIPAKFKNSNYKIKEDKIKMVRLLQITIKKGTIFLDIENESR